MHDAIDERRYLWTAVFWKEPVWIRELPAEKGERRSGQKP
jgi:hypothetical protein